LPRSVTRIAVIVGTPLLALATMSILGSHAPRHDAARPVAAINPAFFHPRQLGLNDPDRLVEAAPSPTATPAVAAAAPAQPRRAPLAARPAAPAPAPRKPAPPPVSGVGGAAGAQFALINQDRARNGVAALAYSASLARVAQYRAQDMLNRNYFSHYDPATGQLAFAQLLRLWGIPYSTAGENIAWSTNPSMAGINTMFMNSPEHRANILKSAYHRVGVGVASNGVKTMVVEVFSN
jgi:uncharacterized protein YkwD